MIASSRATVSLESLSPGIMCLLVVLLSGLDYVLGLSLARGKSLLCL
jgi:hypothetical protein